eukprot:3326757-Pyramimonas_sp.AAC.1
MAYATDDLHTLDHFHTTNMLSASLSSSKRALASSKAGDMIAALYMAARLAASRERACVGKPHSRSCCKRFWGRPLFG